MTSQLPASKSSSSTAAAAQRPTAKQYIYSSVRPTADGTLPSAASLTSSTSTYTDRDLRVDDRLCTSCGASDMVEDTQQGQRVCSSCGVTARGGIIDIGTEWRTFADNGSSKASDMSRVGGVENRLMDGTGLSTVKASNNGGSTSSLARTHNRTAVDLSQQYFLDGCKFIRKLGHDSGLARSIVNRAEEIFTMSCEFEHVKQKWRLPVVVTACLSLAYTHRSLNELCVISTVTTAAVSKCRKELRLLKCHRQTAARGDAAFDESASLTGMVTRFSSELNLQDTSMVNAVHHIVQRAQALDIIQGRHHAALVGGAIYLATQLKPQHTRLYAEISVVSQKAANTVQLAYKDKTNGLYHHRAQLVPDGYVPSEVLTTLK